MTRDVMVSVSGIHTVDGESGDVAVVTSGIYYKKNGKHYIIYDEFQEGLERPLRCTIKLYDRKAEIIRGGDVRAHMEFEVGKTTVNCYSTPFGEIILTISTFDMEVREEEDSVRAERSSYWGSTKSGGRSSATSASASCPSWAGVRVSPGSRFTTLEMNSVKTSDARVVIEARSKQVREEDRDGE